MRVKRLTRHEEPHDFARTLEDGVDATVAEETLHRFRFLAARPQRLRRLVAPTAANLHGVIHDPPRRLRAPEFAQCGLESHVGVLVLIHQAGGVKCHGLHRVGVGRHARQLLGHRRVFPDGLAPLLAPSGPALRDVEATLRQSDTRGGQREPPGVQRGQRDAQALAFAE